jgi:alanine-glyoxylate transaminase/serine-glyoxylate transaminase/serine-pyruvate transaminase
MPIDTAPAPIAPPARLLCGPGPTNVAPSVLEAMQRPMVGHLDPDLHDILLEVVDMLGRVYRRDPQDGFTLPLSSTGTAAMEAGIANLIDPGATVVVGVSGYFGARLACIARRWGARVVEVRAPWGEPVDGAAMADAIAAQPRVRLVAVVHAETSTGVRQPLDDIAAAARDAGAFLMVDCVTSLGGIRVDTSADRIDFAYSCTQKCLAAPPGMAPVSLSDRAADHIRRRPRPATFALDLAALHDYWIRRPAAYHHTVPVLHIYALHEALRLAHDEGLEARWARHAAAGAHLQGALAGRGLRALASDPAVQLPQLTAIRVPEGVDGDAVRRRVLREHGIEVGGGLGPDAPAMWRVGLMGDNANAETVDRVLAALDAALAAEAERPEELAIA